MTLKFHIMFLTDRRIPACLSLLEMFAPSTKASTHAFTTICGCPKRCRNILRAFDSPPGTPSKPLFSGLLRGSENLVFHETGI